MPWNYICYRLGAIEFQNVNNFYTLLYLMLYYRIYDTYLCNLNNYDFDVINIL